MLDPSELTPERLHPSRVIAKGGRIHDIQRLATEYGGQASQWTKRAGLIFILDQRLYGINWYQHHGIGSFDHKLVPQDGPPQ